MQSDQTITSTDSVIKAFIPEGTKTVSKDTVGTLRDLGKYHARTYKIARFVAENPTKRSFHVNRCL